MFFQKDYVLRMIEMMGDLMRRIKELVDDLQRMNLLEDACHKHCGLSLQTAENLSAESLTTLLPPVPRLMMSELLYARASSFALPIDVQEELLRKSLHLLASLWGEGALCELRAQRLQELKSRTFPLLSPEELLDCARFFGEAEAYSHMEDALFQAVERMEATDSARAAAITEGAQMLEDAATAAPQALAFCGCTSEEMLLAAQELRGMP